MSRFFSNKILIISMIAWITVQFIKTLVDFIKNKKWDVKRLLEAGGMPSSHSAFVCSLTYGIASKYGVSSDVFAVALSFSFVVMYDAMGVRNEAGKHAKILNIIQKNAEIPEKVKLNESLGHRPIEVLFGAAFGVGISAVSQLFVPL